MSFVGNLLFWIVGLQYTTTFRASIIANLHPLLLVITMRAMGVRVSYLEWFGTLISISGLVIVGLPDLYSEETTSTTGKNELYGFFLCFLAAACEVAVLFNRIKTKQYVPLMQVSQSTIVVLAAEPITTFTVHSDHQHHCGFGGLS